MDYDKAARFWVEKDKEGKRAPDAKAKLLAFLASHKVCALATGSGSFVRCTPLEYAFLDGAFWIFSEGGLKYRGLKDNKEVSLAVFDVPEGNAFGHLHSAQISAKAEIVEPFSPEYLKLLGYKHIPEIAVRKMAEPIHLIKIVPLAADYLDSDFKKEGFDSRQSVRF